MITSSVVDIVTSWTRPVYLPESYTSSSCDRGQQAADLACRSLLSSIFPVRIYIYIYIVYTNFNLETATHLLSSPTHPRLWPYRSLAERAVAAVRMVSINQILMNLLLLFLLLPKHTASHSKSVMTLLYRYSAVVDHCVVPRLLCWTARCQ